MGAYSNDSKSMKVEFHDWLKRPLSWSSISSWEYSREQWYDKYILGKKDAGSVAMAFGKKFAKSVEDRKPIAPVTIYEHVEFELKGIFGGIPLIGYIDTYQTGSHLIDHKTGAKPWDKKRADGHMQLTMYLFMLYLLHKVKPEDVQCAIEWIQTVENQDFTIGFVQPIKVHHFKTKRTTRDILKFGVHIREVHAEMQEYIKERA